MWLNKSVITINGMFKILDITSLRSIFFKINMNLEQVLLTKHIFSLYAKCTKMNQGESKQIEVDPNRLNGTKWTEWTKYDRIRPNWTEQDKVDQCGLKKS